AATAAVRRARHVIATHVGRDRDIGASLGAGPLHCQAQREDLRPAGMLEDLRAGSVQIAAMQHTVRWIVADGVGEIGPPLRALTAQLIELGHSVGLTPTSVRSDTASGDDRPRAFVHDPIRLVLIEALHDVAAGVVARLRDAADHLTAHLY